MAKVGALPVGRGVGVVGVRDPPENRRTVREEFFLIGVLLVLIMGIHLALLPFTVPLSAGLNTPPSAGPASIWEYAFFGSFVAAGLWFIITSRYIPSELEFTRTHLATRFGNHERRVVAVRQWRVAKARLHAAWHFDVRLEGGGYLKLRGLPPQAAYALAQDLAARVPQPQAAAVPGAHAYELPDDPGATIVAPAQWPEPWALTLFDDGRRLADPPMRPWEKPGAPLEKGQWQTSRVSAGRAIGAGLVGAYMILPVAFGFFAGLRIGGTLSAAMAGGVVAAATTWVAGRLALRDHFEGNIGISRIGFEASLPPGQVEKAVEAALRRLALSTEGHVPGTWGNHWRVGEGVSLSMRLNEDGLGTWIVLETRGKARMGIHQRLKGAILEGLAADRAETGI